MPTGETSFFAGDDPANTFTTTGLNAFDGGDDSFYLTLTGNSAAYLRGDFESFRSIGTIHAGADHFVIDGATSATSAIMGDAVDIKEGTLVGGDDIIDAGGVTSGKFIIYGDVASIQDGTLVGGHDTIIGGDGGITVHGDGSIISGGPVYSVVIGGNDDIQTGSGNDQINGDASRLTSGSLTGGDDVIDGGDGQDHIYGDLGSLSSDSTSNEVFVAGDDTIYGGDGGDWIRGDIGSIQDGSGINVSNITFGNDMLFGGDGDDEIYGDIENDYAGILNTQSGGDDYIDGGNGDDYLDAGGHVNGDTAAYGSAGSSVEVSLLLQGASQDTVGAGLDTLIGFENLSGSNFADILTGNDLSNVIDGHAGSDTIYGNAGHDVLIGDDGVDYLSGGQGNDSIYGGDDDDILTGFTGDDLIDGGDGIDTANYADLGASITVSLNVSGAQTVSTAGGSDTLVSIENLIGSKGGDVLTGSHGANVIEGFTGNDTIFGLNGDDTISGGIQNDLLRGNKGDDTIIGGAGRDIMAGGSEADVFVFENVSDSSNGGFRDRVQDFVQGVDLIDLSSIDAVTGGFDNAFAFIGDLGFGAGGPGSLRFLQVAANNKTIVEIDVDGDNVKDMQFELTGIYTLTADDFIL